MGPGLLHFCLLNFKGQLVKLFFIKISIDVNDDVAKRQPKT